MRRRLLIALTAAGATSLAATAGAQFPKPAFDFHKMKPTNPAQEVKVYDHLDLAAMAALGAVLARHVAYVQVDVARGPDEIGMDATRDGFGVPVRSHQIALLSFIVDKAERVRVSGPTGEPIEAQVVLHDPERRVAIIETKRPLGAVGLEPPRWALKADLAEGQPVFAMLSTEGEPLAMSGWLLSPGDEHLFDGLPSANFTLRYGMPVFDNQARFVGYARAVFWDVQKNLLVTPEVITAARTSTAAAPSEPAKPTRPWWAK